MRICGGMGLLCLLAGCLEVPTDDDTEAPGDASADADGDGATADDDCDDTDAAVNPGATELCDGIDNDCDGDTDDDDASDAGAWYPDADGDGYGADYPRIACQAPDGHVAQGGDCDDGDSAFNPGATEDDCSDPSDYDCDGSVQYVDADGDGYAACEECDDDEREINPSATEICDGADNDCDGDTDEADAAGAATWYADTDTDGYGDAASPAISCDVPTGYVAGDSDCDDTDGGIHPGAGEICDGADNDCDGDADEGLDQIWYADFDGDGYGANDHILHDCANPSYYVAAGGDCDDADPSTYGGAPEACDGTDNDCDGDAGDDAGSATFFGADGTLTDAGDDLASWTSPQDGILWICEGTWETALSIRHDVEILGLDGKDLVILDGAGTGSVITIEAGGLTTSIAGVTVQSGVGAATVTTRDTPPGSRSGTAGGGVLCDAEATLSIRDATLRWNAADLGGGLYAGSGCEVDVSDVVFSENDAGTWGGGLMADDTTLSVFGGSVSYNEAASGGGGFALSGNTDAEFQYVEIERNGAGSGGGGAVKASWLQADGGTFLSNDANSGDGGGLHVYAGGARLANVTLTDNDSADDGGAIYADYAKDTGVIDVYIPAGNPGLRLDGVEISGNDAGDGGGIYLLETNASAVETSFSGNAATNGDDLHVGVDSEIVLVRPEISGSTNSVYPGGIPSWGPAYHHAYCDAAGCMAF